MTHQNVFVYYLVFLLFLSQGHLAGQAEQNETLIYQEISPDNPDNRILDEWLGNQKMSMEQGRMIQVTFKPWQEFSGPALKELLPHHRFYLTSYRGTTTRKGRGKVKDEFFITVLASVDQSSRTLRIYDEYGNYEPFADLLREGRIVIDSQLQARRVWDAFCELHRKAWRDQPSRQIDDYEWWLGEIIIDQIRYVYRVSVDDRGRVLSGRLLHEAVTTEIR